MPKVLVPELCRPDGLLAHEAAARGDMDLPVNEIGDSQRTVHFLVDFERAGRQLAVELLQAEELRERTGNNSLLTIHDQPATHLRLWCPAPFELCLLCVVINPQIRRRVLLDANVSRL